MKLAAGDVLKAVYEVLNGNVNANSYEINYAKRVLLDGGTVIATECLPIYFTQAVDVYTNQVPSFTGKAYIYIYHLNTSEVGAVDEFMYDVSISVKCAIQTKLGAISPQDVHAMGNAVSELLQPNTFSRIEVDGYTVTSQFCTGINYIEGEIMDSRYESAVVMDWLIRVESI